MTDSRAPSVLVLMAARNGALWIEEQLRSILTQRHVRCRLTVRDDASTDATPAAVQRVADGRSDVTLERAAVPSGSAAANFFALMHFADVGDCAYVAFADQDDIWHPDKLARATACLASSGAAGYSSSVRAFWPNGRSAVLRQNPSATAADHLFEGAGQGCTFVMTATFFRRIQSALTSQRSSFDGLHYHDWAIYALCRSAGERWFFDARATLDYRQHASNDTGARFGLAAVRKRLALVRSGWYRAQIDAVVSMCIAVAGEAGNPATTYRRLADAARAGRRGRYALFVFVLRSGRRRTSDRCVLAWAALNGHLSHADPVLHAKP